jgi:hypothetical protein
MQRSVSVFRCLFAGAFPLFGAKLFETLGIDWGIAMLAFICLGIGLPFLLLVCLSEQYHLFPSDHHEATPQTPVARIRATLSIFRFLFLFTSSRFLLLVSFFSFPSSRFFRKMLLADFHAALRVRRAASEDWCA